MKTCLITEFELFLKFPKNPTEEVVKALDGETIDDVAVVGHVFAEGIETAEQLDYLLMSN